MVATTYFIVAVLLAATPTYRGNEPGFWQQTAIVFAVIDEVEPSDENNTEYDVLLKPLACLAGQFDPSSVDAIKVQVIVGRGRVLTSFPDAGTCALIALRKDKLNWSLPNAWFTFMPGEVPLVEISDFADPRVRDLLTAIRASRREDRKLKSDEKIPATKFDEGRNSE